MRPSLSDMMTNVYFLLALHVRHRTWNDGADHCNVSESLAGEAADIRNIASHLLDGKEQRKHDMAST